MINSVGGTWVPVIYLKFYVLYLYIGGNLFYLLVYIILLIMALYSIFFFTLLPEMQQ